MGLDFTRPTPAGGAQDALQAQGQTAAAPPAEQENYQQYDIIADRQ